MKRTGPLYAWALPRTNRKWRNRFDRCQLHPPAPPAQTRPAVGGALRGHDTSLATGGQNTDGGPGLPWDVALYVPLVVLMLVKNLNAREMEAYLAENVVARVCIGRQGDPHRRFGTTPTSLGPIQPWAKDGVDESTP